MSENSASTAKQNGFADTQGALAGKPRASRLWWSSIVLAIVFVLFVLAELTNYIEKWLWMRQLDYTDIFWTLLSVRCAMFCAALVFAFLYLWVNLRQATKDSGTLRVSDRAWKPTFLSRADTDTQTGNELPPRLMKAAVVLVSGGVALFFALGFYTEWDKYLRFRYGAHLEYPIRFSASTSASTSFICRSTSCCKRA